MAMAVSAGTSSSPCHAAPLIMCSVRSPQRGVPGQVEQIPHQRGLPGLPRPAEQHHPERSEQLKHPRRGVALQKSRHEPTLNRQNAEVLTDKTRIL